MRVAQCFVTLLLFAGLPASAAQPPICATTLAQLAPFLTHAAQMSAATTIVLSVPGPRARTDFFLEDGGAVKIVEVARLDGGCYEIGTVQLAHPDALARAQQRWLDGLRDRASGGATGLGRVLGFPEGLAATPNDALLEDGDRVRPGDILRGRTETFVAGSAEVALSVTDGHPSSVSRLLDSGARLERVFAPLDAWPALPPAPPLKLTGDTGVDPLFPSLMAVEGAVFIAGVTMLAISGYDQSQRLDQASAGHLTAADDDALRQRIHDERVAGAVLTSVGGVAALATGLAWWLTSRDSAPEPVVLMVPTLDTLSVIGTF